MFSATRTAHVQAGASNRPTRTAIRGSANATPAAAHAGAAWQSRRSRTEPGAGAGASGPIQAIGRSNAQGIMRVYIPCPHDMNVNPG